MAAFSLLPSSYFSVLIEPAMFSNPSSFANDRCFRFWNIVTLFLGKLRCFLYEKEVSENEPDGDANCHKVYHELCSKEEKSTEFIGKC